MKELKPCGTKAAYERHRRRNETPCDDCKAANSATYRPNGAAAQKVAEKAWAAELDKNPPVIVWRKRPDGVFIPVYVDDPHPDGGHNSTKQACKWNHPFTEENTIITSDGRQCRTCKNERRKALTPEQKQRANELRNISRRRLRQERSVA